MKIIMCKSAKDAEELYGHSINLDDVMSIWKEVAETQVALDLSH